MNEILKHKKVPAIISVMKPCHFFAELYTVNKVSAGIYTEVKGFFVCQVEAAGVYICYVGSCCIRKTVEIFRPKTVFSAVVEKVSG